MAKVPGFLRRREKIDEAELELARNRTAARLAEIFGGTTASTPAQTDVLAETEQPIAAQAPRDTDPAVSTGRRGASRPPSLIETPPDLVGVMAAPERPDVDAPPAPDAAALVGVVAGQGLADEVGPADDWRSRADAYILAQAFGIARGAAPGRGADSAVRVEAPQAKAIEPAPAAVRVDLRRAGPAVEQAKGTAILSDARSPNRTKAIRPTPEARPREEGQLRANPSRPASVPRGAPAKPARAPSPVALACPYCARLLQPPPMSSRGCPRCRRRIIVKHVDGRAVYLTVDAVPIFDAERRRSAHFGRWIREQQRWLKLAAAAGAPGQRTERLAAALPSEDAVEVARTLYLTAVDRSFRSARADHRWEDASRIRREQAMALFRVAGSPLPPPEALVELHREGVVAELRGIAEIAKEAELTSAACCDVCRADDGQICRISEELGATRLPHQGCPKGLCRCRWDLAARDRTTQPRSQSRAHSPAAASS
ncbi:MAG: hypothetical protein ACHQ01_06250 [Candidatus Limnocylindrales bacterium]